MKLTVEQIKKIALGAVYAEEEKGIVKLHRFSREQEALYEVTNEDFYERALTPAGVKLSFETDSENLFLKIFASPATGRRYFSIDVFVGDEMVGSLNNFTGVEFPKDYYRMRVSVGEFSKNFYLGKEKKKVCVHLPWSVWIDLLDVSLDDGAYIKPIKPAKKLLAYGDSITHGYDALHPSNRYVAKLAKALDAEEFNKAIGGEKFFPPLAKIGDDIDPDYITVAYGTNDWDCMSAATFRENCRDFFSNLVRNYPNAKIFAISPIWREAMEDEREWGFSEIEENIRAAVKDYETVTVISGLDLVPWDEKYFADRIIHPNDSGFGHYSDSLYKKIKEHI